MQSAGMLPSGCRGVGFRRVGRVLAGCVVLLLRVTPLHAQQQVDYRNSPYLRIDPSRIVLSARDTRTPCGECHSSEYEVWRMTKHATGFDSLHRSDGAHDILQRMGLVVTKRKESLCLRCHYTVGPELTAIAGVSCESCHGPAADWVNVHNKWGEGIKKPEDEAPEHRRQRIEQSIKGGMLRPSGDLYAVAANCFECHTVPIEELVNKGGHTTGSARFDLLANVGRIRHNFLQQQWGGAAENREPTAERRRLMFAVGRILSYEFALRGLAVATTDDRYSKSMLRRVQQSYRELDEVARTAAVPALREILVLGARLRLAPDNKASLSSAADQIRVIGEHFATTSNGADLAALDALIAGGAPPELIAAADTGAGGAAHADSANVANAASAGAGRAAGAAATAATARPPGAAALPGSIRTRPEWFPAVDSRYRTTLPDCAKCHGDADDWWARDKHQGSADPLLNKAPKAREIATLYGIGPDRMTRADQICMNCHGTATSDAPHAEVLTGVSCERCHGPSSEWLEPHEKGGNPQLGMTALKDAEVRARTCGNCHRITDERLLAAGHTSGDKYDFVDGNHRIRHFPDKGAERGRAKRGAAGYTAADDARLRAAFASVVSSRPIPQVTVVAVTAAAVTSSGAAQPRTERPQTQSLATATGGSDAPPTASLPPRPSATSSRRGTANADTRVELPPLPERADTLSTEQILLLVKQRLERLYALLGHGN